MNHRQILDKLTIGPQVACLDAELRTLVFQARCFARHGSIGGELPWILQRLEARWGCVPRDDTGVHYHRQITLAKAVLLHKYGYAEERLTREAVDAVALLNERVVLGDAFFRQQDDINAFLGSAPVPLNRNPPQSASVPFYLAADVIAIGFGGLFLAAYVHRIVPLNKEPIIELYDAVFSVPPELKELERCPAFGQPSKNGPVTKRLLSVAHLTYLPDPSGQVSLVAACVETPPDDSALEPSRGLYTVSDIFSIQRELAALLERH